jgi:NodT family efflux transporter outer membrane factor (OMF) lipoprotein
VFALALLAGACAALPASRPAAQLSSANSLGAEQALADAQVVAERWPATDWWRALGDPQLDALIAEALEGSPSLRVAAARTREAIARAGVADAARAPQITAGGTVTRERYSENGLLPPPYGGRWNTLSELSATLSWDLDLWGRARNAHESQLDAARAAAVDADAARLALSVAIAHAYVQLGRAYEQRDVANATLKQRQDIYALTRDRNAAGIDSRLELKQAESALPATRAQVLQLEESIALTRDALAALLGKGPERGASISRPAPVEPAALTIPSRVPADLLGRRPDIVAQRWRVESASHSVASAKADFYPNINLTALIGFQNLGTSNLLTAANREIGAGPALSLPIFDGGRRRATLAAEGAAYDAQVERYNQLLADALRQVADGLVSAKSVAAQRGEQQQGLATASDAYQLAVLRYREGVGNYLQVLTTETQLLAERALEVDLRARTLDVSIELINALGGGFEPGPAATAARHGS